MHHAPPVQVPVGRFAWGRAVGVALALLSAGALALAWWLSPPSMGLALAGGLVWGLAVLSCACLLGRERLPTGELCWDGESWSLQTAQGLRQSVVVEVRLDLGTAMLLAVRLSQGPRPWRRYVWLRAVHLPGLWHRCRCAVYGRDIL